LSALAARNDDAVKATSCCPMNYLVSASVIFPVLTPRRRKQLPAKISGLLRANASREPSTGASHIARCSRPPPSGFPLQ